MYDNTKAQFHKFVHHPFRPNQEAAIQFIHESTKPIIVIKASTGFGKSLAGIVAGALHPARVRVDPAEREVQLIAEGDGTRHGEDPRRRPACGGQVDRFSDSGSV